MRNLSKINVKIFQDIRLILTGFIYIVLKGIRMGIMYNIKVGHFGVPFLQRLFFTSKKCSCYNI